MTATGPAAAGWRARLTLLAAVGVCVAALLTPTAATTAPGPATGPATLTAVWPHATVFPIPASIDGGYTYQPLAVLADRLSIGEATSLDGTTARLVTVATPTTAGPATIRILQAGLVTAAVSFDAFATTATDVYWMRTTADRDGNGHETLWRAPLAGGPTTLVTADTGGTLTQGSVYDLQVTDGRLAWVATPDDNPTATEIRTVALTGGPVHIHPVPGMYTLSRWPWLSRLPGTGAPAEVYNPTTGQHLRPPAITDATTTCSPTWCVLQTSAADGSDEVDLMRIDGTDRHRLGDDNTALVTIDTDQLDHFEALADTPTTASTINPVEQLWLYDITTGRSTEITGAATAAFARGAYLWWSTGDNETLTWYALDLTTLH